jgi:hypothetical protein
VMTPKSYAREIHVSGRRVMAKSLLRHAATNVWNYSKCSPAELQCNPTQRTSDTMFIVVVLQRTCELLTLYS